MLSGCGVLVDGASVETYLVTLATGIDIEEIASLSNDIAKIERDKVELVVEYLEHRVDGIIENFINSSRS